MPRQVFFKQEKAARINILIVRKTRGASEFSRVHANQKINFPWPKAQIS